MRRVQCDVNGCRGKCSVMCLTLCGCKFTERDVWLGFCGGCQMEDGTTRRGVKNCCSPLHFSFSVTPLTQDIYHNTQLRFS